MFKSLLLLWREKLASSKFSNKLNCLTYFENVRTLELRWIALNPNNVMECFEIWLFKSASVYIWNKVYFGLLIWKFHIIFCMVPIYFNIRLVKKTLQFYQRVLFRVYANILCSSSCDEHWNIVTGNIFSETVYLKNCISSFIVNVAYHLFV